MKVNVQRVRTAIRRYHPVVWWIVGATAVTRVTAFMVMPFMALYMAAHTHASAGTIGLAIGMAALTSTVFGFVGGPIADKYGRKGSMVLAMAISALAMIGFANARVISVFFALSALNGMTRTLFGPASQAMLTDVTEPQLRSSVFAMRYWAINVGASIGPVIGGYLGTVATGWTFYLAAAVNAVYAIVILLAFPESSQGRSRSTQRNGLWQAWRGFLRPLQRKPVTLQDASPTLADNEESVKPPQQAVTFSRALKTVARDKALLLFVLATVFSNIGYSQIESTLPQFMGHLFSSTLAARNYAWVLTSNALEVVVLQLPLTWLTNKLGLIPSMIAGQVLFGIGYFTLGFSHSLPMFIAAMFIVTMGEITVFPRNTEYLSILAAEDLRATYFGASSLRSIGFFVGPWLGGILLDEVHGGIVFGLIAVVAVAAVPFYLWSNRLRLVLLQRGQQASTQDPVVNG